MATHHPRKTILVVGPGPRKAVGTDQFAHGVVSAATTFASEGHGVILIDNAPYLALPPEVRGIERRIEPLTLQVLEQIAADSGADLVYADAGGDGAQGLAQALAQAEVMGSGPEITAAALDRSKLFGHLESAGLTTPVHAIVDTAPAAIDATRELDFPLLVAITQGSAPEDAAQDTPGIGPKTADTPVLVYNQSDLSEWAEQQLDVRPEAALILEKAPLGWQRFEAIVFQDGDGHQALAGLQAYLTPTGKPTGDAGWVQPPVSANRELVDALTQTSLTFFKGSDLKGMAALTLAVDPDSGDVMVLDLTLGTSRNIAFAAAASGLPLYETAARIAMGASLKVACGDMPEASDNVAVRLPVKPNAGGGAVDKKRGAANWTTGDVMGLGEGFKEAFENTRRACGANTMAASTAVSDLASWAVDALARAGGDSPAPAPFLRVPANEESDAPAFHWSRIDAAVASGAFKETRRILVIAGSPNTIGQSREQDLAAAQTIGALKSAGCEVMVLASDPLSAVVHSDGEIDVCLGPATADTVSAIHSRLPLDGVVPHCAPGGFRTLAEALTAAGITVLGTASRALTLLASPMALHERLTDLGIPHPHCALASDTESALKQAEAIGYPLLLRPLTPSGGEGPLAGGQTALVMNPEMLATKLQTAAFADTSWLMEEFIEFAIEVTADAICDGVGAVVPQAVEHIELAGIHPGDSAWVIPPYSTPLRHVDTISEYLHKIATEFELKGFISGRFAFFNDTVYLLSVDLPFSRTAAMVSDACDLPLFAAATRAMLGESLEEIQLAAKRQSGFSVREAIFPVSTEAKLASRLGPVMQSSGEVIGRADSFGMAYYKAQEAAGDRLPTAGSVLITVTDADKPSIIEPARLYREMGFRILTTRGTAAFLEANGIATEIVRKLGMGRPDLVDAIKTRQVDLVINTPSGHQGQMDDGYIRKAAIQYGIPYVSTPAGALAAAKGIAARTRQASRGK